MAHLLFVVDILAVGPIGNQNRNATRVLGSVHIATDKTSLNFESYCYILFKNIWERCFGHGVEVLELVRHGGVFCPDHTEGGRRRQALNSCATQHRTRDVATCLESD